MAAVGIVHKGLKRLVSAPRSPGVIAGLLLGALLCLAGGCDSSQSTEPDALQRDSMTAEPRVTTEKARSAPKPTEPAGFTGVFSTMDELQRCKATARVVVCASMGSGQLARLDGSGASYAGEVATTFPPADPLGLGNEIETASGIRCENTRRGIECNRGGHGFVIGDSAVVILRGSHEDRYEPTLVEEEPAAPQGEIYACEDFGTWEEAQAAYEADPTDPSFLDDDFDGVACEEAFGLDDPGEPSSDPADAGCDPNYEGACIPSVPYDLDCPEVAAVDFYSVGSDPHGFDGDGDGIACET